MSIKGARLASKEAVFAEYLWKVNEKRLLNAIERGMCVHLAFDNWAAVFVGALNSVFLDTGKTKHGVT
jgi:hypothetical protein